MRIWVKNYGEYEVKNDGGEGRFYALKFIIKLYIFITLKMYLFLYYVYIFI